MQDLLAAWGERIREELDDKGRSQNWLAATCGTDKGTISRVVNGKLNPNDELKWRIAGALGIRMDRLWAWPQVVPPMPEKAAA